jgi:uncharacterized membrane protein YcaP (DUF421 family)
MDLVLRASAVYVFLLVVLRLAGRRTLSEMSTFDFVLVLIVSEATQNALLDDDRSLSAGLAVILTLVALDRAAAWLKSRSGRAERLIEGGPLTLVDHGRVLQDRLDASRVTVDDVLQSARHARGIGTLAEIRYAVLEPSGGISVIPMDDRAELERCIEAAVARALASRTGSA